MPEYSIIKIHAAAPEKPAVGAVCNGCGVCCASAPCPVSAVLLAHRHGSCPALTWEENLQLYRCGMLQTPSHFLRWLPGRLDRAFSVVIRRWIAIGVGCDSEVELENNNL